MFMLLYMEHVNMHVETRSLHQCLQLFSTLLIYPLSLDEPEVY